MILILISHERDLVVARASILLLNGPNLDMLGLREPAIYGTITLKALEAMCVERAVHLGLTIECYQSNNEALLIESLHKARTSHDGIIINAGAFSHTSIALLDALLITELPIIEVHLSNLFKRESFRHHSYISSVAVGLICGFGSQSYQLALDAMAVILKQKSTG